MANRTHTLLCVDDEPDVLDSLRHLFHRQYRVLTAAGGEAALEILHRDDVHVILSDQRMPGMPGDVFLAQAGALRPDTIRMLSTGFADIQAVVRAINEGRIFRYILKPWDAVELEYTVRQAVEQYELLADRKRLIAQLQDANAQLTQANQELREADQLKTAFIEVASHEFNTPITLVQGLSQLLLLTNPARDPKERGIVEQIAASSAQLGRLVSSVLTLLQDGNYKPNLSRSPTPLAQLLREAASQVAPFVEQRHLRLDVDLADDLGTFEIDAAKIQNAILNLLTNAIKFTPDGGEIRLSARLSHQDEAEIVVADRGIGMEPRALRRLFSPFFTEFDPGRHSTGELGFEKRGVGLGLSIVRQFVDWHGGTVQAESESGQGTSVSIRLPRSPFPKPGFEVEYNVPEPPTSRDASP